MEHDVANFAAALGARLASQSRHINVFLGAGASRACGLPDVRGLEAAIAEKLEETQATVFEHYLESLGLEETLTRLRRIAALVQGDDRVDGISGVEAAALDHAICQVIVDALKTPSQEVAPPMQSFAAWLSRASYSRAVEVFSVNYDLLVETALDDIGANYFDGFAGIGRAKFRPDLVEPSTNGSDSIPSSFVRLWKLHGSLNWSQEINEVRRLGGPVTDSLSVAIYPSDAKYEQSRRMPFVVLQDRLRRGLLEPESITLVSGYSWGDDHLNELFFDSSQLRPRSEVLAFCYDAIPDILAGRALVTPNFQVLGRDEAIVGGVRGPWTPGDESLPEDIWREGFQLGDFSKLAGFLARGARERFDRSSLEVENDGRA